MEKLGLNAKANAAPTQPGLITMRLVATMDIDNTGPNCIPRLCTFQVTRVAMLNPSLADSAPHHHFVLAVKMQGIRRVLRSNEISANAPLDLTFEFVYPHFLKPRGNKLEVMLQRRKRPKHRPAMGFKTVASGWIDMAHILQRPAEGQKLNLTVEGKDGPEVQAELMVGSLISQPLDESESRGRSRAGRRKSRIFVGAGDPSPDDVDDDDDYDDEDDLDDADAGSDSDGGTPAVATRGRPTKHLRSSGNLKQRFAALLRKFKVSEEEALSGVVEDDDDDNNDNNEDIEDIFKELEDCYPSDSDHEDDDLSVMSAIATPRPSLRPFFSEGSDSHHTLSTGNFATRTSVSGDQQQLVSRE